MINHNPKPIFRQLVFHNESSLNVKVDTGEKLKNAWHYHPEIELILLKKSEGTRIIGTSTGTFEDNDLFLIGKNTPHIFLHEERYLQDCCLKPEAVVVQFYETFMGKEFLALPEFKEIQYLFSIAKHGLALTDQGKKKVIPLMERMLQVSSLDRILLLLQILSVIVNKTSYDLLGSEGLVDQSNNEDDIRIEKIMNFTFENYDQNIKLEQVAQLTNLTKESFCRYFKAKTGKSYLELLIEVRINKACQKILKNQMSIKEIAYSCGFDSLSNFHLQFKKIMKQSPIEYKTSHSSRQVNINCKKV